MHTYSLLSLSCHAQVTDIAAVVAAVKKINPAAIVVVDNTFQSAYFQRPLELGVGWRAALAEHRCMTAPLSVELFIIISMGGTPPLSNCVFLAHAYCRMHADPPTSSVYGTIFVVVVNPAG